MAEAEKVSVKVQRQSKLVLAVDRVSGVVYLAGTSMRNSSGHKGIPLWKSTDGGITFNIPITVRSDIMQSDKPWIAVDDAVGTGQHDVYLGCIGFVGGTSATNKALWLTVSIDGHGTNWSSPVPIRQSADVSGLQSPIPVVGPGHAVYAFWFESTGPYPYYTNWLKMRPVLNRGAALGGIQTICRLVTTNVTIGNLELKRSNTATNTDTFRVFPFPVPAANPGKTNHLYVAYADKGTNANDKADVFFVSSTNGGTNWTSPLRVNADTTTNDQWMPMLCVKPDGTQLFLAWYDRRNDTNNSLIELYGRFATIATNGSVSFHTNDFRITTTNFPMVFAGTLTSNTNQGHYDPVYPPEFVNLHWWYPEWPLPPDEPPDFNLTSTNGVALGFAEGRIQLANVQFVKCQYPIDSTTSDLNEIILDNSLFYSAKYGIKGGRDLIVRGQHVTAHQCEKFAYSPSGGDSYAYLTNCLLVGVTNWGSEFTFTTSSTVYYATDVSGVFQTVGSSSHYLIAGSTNRDAGTTNLNAELLAALRKKTTYPPVEITTNFTANTTLLPQAARDTDLPDLGFHFDPLDVVVSGRTLTNSTLTLTNGVVLGTYGASGSYGIFIASGGQLISGGSPTDLNRIVRYNTVQEQATTNWSSSSVAPSIKIATSSSVKPQVRCRFTGFSIPGSGGYHFYGGVSGGSAGYVFNFQDCQFAGSGFYVERPAVTITNSLFERVYVDIDDASQEPNHYLYNNLFIGGTLTGYPSDPATWLIKDNFFDKTTISATLDGVTHGYNGYVTNYSRLTPNQSSDVVLTNSPVYQASSLGRYYYPTNDGMLSRLINAGSRNATNAGLYHFTITTNQVKEAASTVDIGFHVVAAVDSSGEAMDSDHGGVPDYLEDANGTGTVNANETDWTAGHASDDDLTGVYGSILVPRYLRCEYRQNPLGVETNYGPPRLYWIVTSNRRAQKQSAYRLLVASSEANLNLNYGDKWDSGVVPTDQTLHVEYKGSALASGQRLWWKVRSWDAWGSPSPWSTNAYFQMGLLSTNDWTAQWLTTATDPGDNVSPMYRRAFVQLTNDIKRATAYVSAKGVYELWIDGQRISPNILAPEWTDYNQRFQYQTYDVTTNLLSANTDGTNHVIGAIVGEGWFHGSVTHDAAGSYSYSNAYNNAHGPKQILVQLRIDRNDGSSNIVASGSSWTCNTNGPIRYASIEHGETYDATKLTSVSNWSTFKYTGEGAVFTAPVATESLITTQLFAQPTDPIQIIRYVQPIDMWTNTNGGPLGNRFVRVFDMGRVIEGWCILSLTNTIEPTGMNIYLRHANSLQLDPNNRQVRGANVSDFSLCGLWGIPEHKAAQKETYVILQTNILQQFQPHFTYHSFRFVEVDAPERIPLDVNSVLGCIIRSSLPVTGAFDSSHRDINQLMTNTLWTLEANVYGLPTAAADRNERYGWFADTDVSAQTSAFLLDMAALWTKSLRDIRDAQWKETFNQGYVYYGAYDITNPRVPGAGVGDVGIESGGIIRPWRLYQNYADTRALREHYLSSSNWLYYLSTNWVANKLSHWIPHADILNGDYFNTFRVLPHDPSWPQGHAQMAKPIHGLWAYIHSADLGASMSSVLQAQALAAGDTVAAGIYGSNYVNYSNMAADGRSYFTNSINGLVAYDSQTGGINRIGNRTQGDYACALYFNMVPDNQRSNCVYLLLNEPNKGILDYNKNWLSSCINHLSTGTFATGPAMHELTRNGYNSKAYELLTDYSFPSWLYQITNGGPAYTGIIGTNYSATTCWERWNGWVSGSTGGYANTGVGTWSSFNELWNASVGEWSWRNVAGINPDEANVGFKNVVLYPKPGGGITNCSAVFNSIRGTIRSSWTNATSTYALSVTVPANATASVFLFGATNLANITESGVAATNTVGLLATPVITNSTALFQIGSGSYIFNVSF